MKELYFVDSNQNIYDEKGIFVGRIGLGYIVDRTRSDLILEGRELGKFVNIRDREEIEKFNKIIKKEEIINNVDALTAGAVKRVTKNENDLIKNYVVADGKIYDDNNSYLSFNEKRKMILMEWLEDSVKSSRVANMTPEELDVELTNAVKGDYKEYNFSSTTKVSKEGQRDDLAVNKAKEVDGMVNTELGIIENGAYDVKDYATVEERENGYQVVAPEVAVTDIQSTSINSGGSDSYIAEEEIQEREVEVEYFYLDNDKNVYKSNGEMVEGVDPKYVIVDEENNLWYGNEKVGVYGGTLDDLSQNLNSTRKNGNVRTLRKKENAGFGSFDVILFILIGLTVMVALFGVFSLK